MTTTRNQTHFENVLVEGCLSGDRMAQQKLYTLYGSKMYPICLRYAGNVQDAQDFFQDGFIKVFKNLHTYKGDGSLEGWIRKLFVTVCIDQLRKKDQHKINDVDDVQIVDNELTGYDKIAMQDLLNIIQELPDTYRTAINLFMVEGFNHKEISEMMNITEGASKSQLFRAKLMLQEKILMMERKLI